MMIEEFLRDAIARDNSEILNKYSNDGEGNIFGHMYLKDMNVLDTETLSWTQPELQNPDEFLASHVDVNGRFFQYPITNKEL